MMSDERSLFDEQRDAIKSEEVKKAFLMRPFPTLGERLANEARRIASRRILVFPWLRPLETMMEHLASLPVPEQERFQRIEALPPHASLPGAGVTRRAGTTSSPAPVSAFKAPGSPADIPSSLGVVPTPRLAGREVDGQSLPPGDQLFPPHLQQQLPCSDGQDSESVRIHTNTASHTLAQAQHADAVTIGPHISFRQGQLQPQEERGFALLAEARRLVSRKIPVFLWLRPLETMMEHLASLPVPEQERFQRIEALPPGGIIGASVKSLGDAGIPYAPEARFLAASWRSPAVWPRSRSDAVRNQASEDRNQSVDAPLLAFAPAGQPLPPHLQQRLQSFVGRGAESVRIHTDATSHALVRAQRADAVTIGQHIFFREGRFRPQEERGFALLTHEALHVVRAMQPGSAWRRATQAGIEEEEQEAASIESRALEARRNASWERALPPSQSLLPAQASRLPRRLPSLPPSRMAGPLAAESVALAPASIPTRAPTQRPMKAATDRSLDNGAPPAPPDMDALKRSLYRDLMRQIKADLERGG
jgi:Domain of unknown function (DUF4157)